MDVDLESFLMARGIALLAARAGRGTATLQTAAVGLVVCVALVAFQVWRRTRRGDPLAAREVIGPVIGAAAAAGFVLVLLLRG